MPNKSVLWACCLLAIFTPSNGLSQELLEFDAFCSYDGHDHSDPIYGFASDAEAEEALERIMSHTGLRPNFLLRAGNVANAQAGIVGSTRMIVYNQEFMLRVRDLTRTDWAAISILAHEVGHHLQGHTLTDLGSRPQLELEADQYSGFVLQRMGASLEEAQAAMDRLGSVSGSPTHPPKSARLAAITNGWLAARDQGGQRAETPSEPRPTNREARSERELLLDLAGAAADGFKDHVTDEPAIGFRYSISAVAKQTTIEWVLDLHCYGNQPDDFNAHSSVVCIGPPSQFRRTRERVFAAFGPPDATPGGGGQYRWYRGAAAIHLWDKSDRTQLSFRVRRR